MTRIALIGGGGFAKEVLELAKICKHKVVGYVSEKKGSIKAPYWGNIYKLKKNKILFDVVCVAFGCVDRQSVKNRKSVIKWLKQQGYKSIPLISPKAIISQGVKVLPGSIVCHGATLHVDSKIKEFSIVNSNAIIGHDALIGENVTIAPAAFVGGNSKVGNNSLIGPGAIILEDRAVGSDVVLGMGGTVARNIPNGSTVMPLRSTVIK